MTRTNKKDLIKKDIVNDIAKDIHTLFENDQLLNNKIISLYKQQQAKPKFSKEISVSDSGIYVHSKQAIRDLNKLISNEKVKSFFDGCKKNQIMKHASYID